MIWQYRKNMSLNYPCGTHYALNPGGQSQDALSSIVYYNNQKREQEDVDGCPEHISDWCEIYLGVTWAFKREMCILIYASNIEFQIASCNSLLPTTS